MDSKNGQYNYLNRCGDSIRQMLIQNHLLALLSLCDTKLGNTAFERLVEGLSVNSTMAHVRLMKNGLMGCKSMISLLEMHIFEVDISKNNIVNVNEQSDSF